MTAISVRAFAPTELLVVIAMVAVLAGMLMPAPGAVRKAAQGVRRRSRLRRLGLAASVFMDGRIAALIPPAAVLAFVDPKQAH